MLTRAVLVALALPLDAVRLGLSDRELGSSNSTEQASAAAPWDHLVTAEGGTRHPLLAALVPPQGQTYKFVCQERFNLLDANDYDWVFDNVEEAGERQTVNQTIAELRGTWTSAAFGHRRTRATDPQAGTDLFDIRNANSAWNPVVAHWTWRIVVPEKSGSIYWNPGDVLFTIQRDLFGDGVLDKEEWHIYRGHISEDDKVYYCHATSTSSYSYECYHSKHDMGRDRQPVAKMVELTSSATNMRDMWRDFYEVTVRENEDAALLLAVATVIDMTKDWSATMTSDREGIAEAEEEEDSTTE